MESTCLGKAARHCSLLEHCIGLVASFLIGVHLAASLYCLECAFVLDRNNGSLNCNSC